MSILKRLVKSFRVLLQELLFLPARGSRWLLKRIRPSSRPSSHRLEQGFILPTVVMVILVVTLLTTTITLRSFNRAKNAGNTRVNQVVLNASLPAIERAKKKIDAVFSDPTLPQGTPSDVALSDVFDKPDYDLGDEVRLRLAFDLNNNGGPPETRATNPNLQFQNEEIVTTAWRFPVDTDNNGRFDSFTLYGIYFRSPPQANGGGFTRERTPLDARTPPQDDSAANPNCAQAFGSFASLTGADGWYKISSQLRKGFYVYTTTVPIANVTETIFPTGDYAYTPDRYEVYQGNRGFAAIEYQQDRTRIPLGNNAVVYEDDLDLFSGPRLNLNGRIIANSNLHAGRKSGLFLYQVSSDESCFYEVENGKIFVGGNVTNNFVGSTGNTGNVIVDLYKEGDEPTTANINGDEKSADGDTSPVAYNTQAYEQRIALLVEAAVANVGNNAGSNAPQSLKDTVVKRLDNEPGKTEAGLYEEEYDKWFRARTRRVPFSEIAFGADGTQGRNTTNVLQPGLLSNDDLRPIDVWHYPVNPNTGIGSNTGLSLRLEKLPATDPDELDTTEKRVGDRVLVGNNLPERWFDPLSQSFSTKESKQNIQGINWTGSTTARYRQARIGTLDDLGDISRDGFWERSATDLPENNLGLVGGLRIVTGAGVYFPLQTNLGRSNVSNVSRVVWPDTMPMIPYTANQTNYDTTTNHPAWLKEAEDRDSNNNPDFLDDEAGNPRPFLKMRASVVYHYTYNSDRWLQANPQPPAPIACISSFYDPTNSTTARNRAGLPGLPTAKQSGDLAWQTYAPASPGNSPSQTVDGSVARSNNGVTYNPPTVNALGINPNDPVLQYQASLVYPNGRLVNPRLAKALDNFPNLSLADRSAIDSTICALEILNQEGVATGYGGTIGPTNNPSPGNYPLPHGTIQEVAFLDAREVKAIEGNANTCGYTEGSSCPTSNNAYDSQPADYGRSATDNPDLNFDAPEEYISQYDLALELRQPQEIRATAIDLDVLRRQQTPSFSSGSLSGPESEYLFPDSGIIYASRDDALPDASDKPAKPDGSGGLYQHELASDRVSATDFWLDPTRRPNGILLMNGDELPRGASNNFQEEEKGLILVSNNPVYIKANTKNNGGGNDPGGFNLHKDAGGGNHEEFIEKLDNDWGDFYNRGTALDTNFACRQNDPRLPANSCPDGDLWRQASILSDSMTLLTSNFRFGFRNEGDFDLRNNQTDNLFRNITTSTLTPANLNIPVKSIAAIDKARRDNGFWDNSFVTNGLSSDNTTGAFGTAIGYNDSQYGNGGQNPLGSSYFNNGVTPVQRRANAPEYVMEICRKLPVSECKPQDWVIGYNQSGGDLTATFTEQTLGGTVDIDGDGILGENNVTYTESEITAEQLWIMTRVGLTHPSQTAVLVNKNQLGAGTTVLAPIQDSDQQYPRRVAFRRQYGNLILDNTERPTPLGINGTNIQEYPYDGSNGVPSNVNNSLWFVKTNNRNQPWRLTSRTYVPANNEPLFYYQPTPGSAPDYDAYKVRYTGEQDDWILPNFSTSTENLAILGIADSIRDLNGSTNDDPADFSVCLSGTSGQGQSKNAQLNAATPNNISGSCPGTITGLVNNVIDRFKILPNATNIPIGGTTFSTIDPNPVAPLTLGPDGMGTPVPNTSVYVYEVSLKTNIVEQANLPTPSSFNFIGSNENNLNNPATLTLTGNEETMFIFKPQNVNFPLLFQNLKLILQGVNPNNIFWISERGMVFAGNNRLAGNFLSKEGTGLPDDARLKVDAKDFGGNTYQIPDYTNTNYTTIADTVIDGGRFLGFDGSGDANYSTFNNAANTSGSASPAELTFNAITTSHQPLLVPVLQLHEPTETNTPINNGAAIDDFGDSNWLQRSPNTNNNDLGIFNLVMATGDSPSRYRQNNPRIIEFNGALANLPRTLENWHRTNKYPLTIRGSFIQLKRSAYATAPFWQLLKLNSGTGSIVNNNRGSFFGYRQGYTQNASRSQPYIPPTRNFGFDVGILAQLPDLFSQRFTLPPTSDPNEYYREVSRDDRWIQALLCGNLSDANRNLTGSRAVNTNYRPGSCIE